MLLRGLLTGALVCVAALGMLADARLGGNMAEFRSQWGRPDRDEVLVRTARFMWRSPQKKNGALPRGISEVEVSFLDEIACEIVVRSKHPFTKNEVVELGRAFIPRFRTSDLSKIKSESGGGITHRLSSGGYLTVWPKEKPAVMVIRSPLFLQNEELFDREEAKIRPPTSNH